MALDNFVMYIAREVAFQATWDEDPTVEPSEPGVSESPPPLGPATPGGASAASPQARGAGSPVPGQGSPLMSAFSYLRRLRQASAEELLPVPGSASAEGARPGEGEQNASPHRLGTAQAHAFSLGRAASRPVQAQSTSSSLRLASSQAHRLTRLQEIQLLLLYKTCEVSFHALSGAAGVVLMVTAIVQAKAGTIERPVAARGLQLAASILLLCSWCCMCSGEYVSQRFLGTGRGPVAALLQGVLVPPTALTATIALLASTALEISGLGWSVQFYLQEAVLLCLLTACSLGLTGVEAYTALSLPGGQAQHQRTGIMAKATASVEYALAHGFGVWLSSMGFLLLAIGYCAFADGQLEAGTTKAFAPPTAMLSFALNLCMAGGGIVALGEWLAAAAAADYIQPPSDGGHQLESARG